MRREQEQKAYRVYITDTLKAISGADRRYLDLIECRPEDNRSGAEIAADVIKTAGLVVR